ncbi:MAG: hypothetical protein WDN03_16675 [Rhizomicrobium sp.]
MADDMVRGGIMSKADHDKITKRHLGAAKPVRSLSAEDIRAMRCAREDEPGGVCPLSQRDDRLCVPSWSAAPSGPNGAALALLDVIRRKGIEGRPLMLRFLAVLIALGLVVAGVFEWENANFYAPGSAEKPTVVLIKAGSGLRGISDALAQAGAIQNADLSSGACACAARRRS